MKKEMRPLWKLLALAQDGKKPTAITCEECMLLIEYDADLLQAGNSLEEVTPIIEQHLSLCALCRKNFDDWLDQMEHKNSIAPNTK